MLNSVKLLLQTNDPLCVPLRRRNAHIVLLQLLYGELGLDQVVVQHDDLPAQRPLLVVVVLGLPGEGEGEGGEGRGREGDGEA